MSKKRAEQPGKVFTKSKSKSDLMLWILVIILTSAGIGANYYFVEVIWALRVVGWIVLASVVVPLALLTQKGKAFWQFAKETRIELRKVVWPTRQETIRTTLIVSGLVLVTAILLWGIDAILLVLVGLLTGQRG